MMHLFYSNGVGGSSKIRFSVFIGNGEITRHGDAGIWGRGEWFCQCAERGVE